MPDTPLRAVRLKLEFIAAHAVTIAGEGVCPCPHKDHGDGCVVCKARAALSLLAGLDLEKAETWTTEKPTVPGWYWARGLPHYPAPQIAYVSFAHRNVMVQAHLPDGAYEGLLENLPDVLWSGPLAAPQEGEGDA